MLSSGMTRSCLSANLRYIPPQNEKLIGVLNMQAAVLIAVRDTESSVFPLERLVIKLDMFPPGHEATRIIPRAIIGLIQPSKDIVRRKVRAGSRNSWQIIPSTTDFGFLKTSMKVLGLMPSATPNMTKASTMLMAFIPASFIFTLIASSCAITSGLIFNMFLGFSGAKLQ